MKSLGRRTFLKKSSQAGAAAFIGSWSLPERLNVKARNDGRLIQKTKNPICRVKKEITVACPGFRMAPWNHMGYIGKGMRREETFSFEQSSDWHMMHLRRISEDNGHTWSEWIPIPQNDGLVQGQYTLSGGPTQFGCGQYDPVSGLLIKDVFQRIFRKAPQIALQEIWKGNRYFCDHGFYQLSADNGRSWGEAYQLKYEEGPDFDPADWGKNEWFSFNQMYKGNKPIVLKNGTVVISATVPVLFNDAEDMKYPTFDNYKDGCVAGAMCFIGKWNKEDQNYRWKKSNSVFLPRQVSSRGLYELELSEFTNGCLLLIMRGSNESLDITSSPGRLWFSVSKDGGHTWSAIKDMRYDTGEQFYAPSSISKTIRSSKTGKLYWVGNISNVPPRGNSPRYPLLIVEIDENGPSFKKDTVTVIDDRDPEHDSEHVQLSNFSLLEDRETQNMEIYLTRLGENADDWRNANAYKYTLIF